jgi:FixJ family two-component response regulator
MARYTKSVLLVDDDPADRTLFSRDLRRLGFEVIQTGSPEEAMAAIVGGRVGCLITDQVMAVPGKELAAIASGVRKDLCIVFLSGASSRRESLPAGAVFIEKEDRAGLRAAVLKCMMAWRESGSPDE